ncbi:hypothetical protein COLO4_29335 [Corchorus olitorius]|uniref:Uncharacterized protein n=1 Tax=Corchorus olitorius TaxID=93759 RepID=A0A1R3HF11_9ROSI|nr:hypothetical protein COLO4_29335 [Corchorus olitorius]
MEESNRVKTPQNEGRQWHWLAAHHQTALLAFSCKDL